MYAGSNFLVGEDAQGKIAYTRNVLQANFSITIAAMDLDSNYVFDLSPVTDALVAASGVDTATPQNMFVSVSPGTSLLVDWTEIVAPSGITPTQTNGELVTSQAGFIIPKGATALNFYPISIPAGDGVVGFVTFSFSS